MPKPLPFGLDSRAYWAFEPEGVLLVFVHGFKGTAQATWMEFPRRLDANQKCRGCDLVFYGYDGVRTRASISAGNFRKFMNQLCTGPAFANRYLHPSVHRPNGLQYKKVVLVGHSLGSIVIRQALLDAHLRREVWGQEIETILFAPAHSGANVSRLLGETVIGLKVTFVSQALVACVERSRTEERLAQ
jgi:triacylglycerol esterase/lipase EstA (alpha/beta hydrolase family)